MKTLDTMKFIYNFAHEPGNVKLFKEIELAASKLYKKLGYLNIDELNISDYNKRYLGEKLRNLVSVLQLYSHILFLSIVKTKIPRREFVFMDYGGGTGILSLLAKELRIGTVVYNDIYDVTCKDAKVIGTQIGNTADFYVQGDIEEVIDFIKKKNINCSAIASYDVIEHIYDVETFFKRIPLLFNNGLTIVMASGANIFNPKIRKLEIKRQIEVEHFDRQKKWGDKKRDCREAYLKVRKEIIVKYITECEKNLSEKEINKLAKRTRGKIKEDILKCVESYLKEEVYPSEPKHLTNTCDPYTGNWAEHLFNPYILKKVLVNKGFTTKILNGYYSSYTNPIKKIIANFMNLAIRFLRKQGINLAPYYILYAKK